MRAFARGFCGIAGILAALPLLWSLPSFAKDRVIETKEGPLKVEAVAGGFEFPWGLAFLPDGRMLVSERAGRLRIVEKDGKISEPLKGVPEVLAEGQGGALDVTLDPKFADNGLVYLSFAEASDGGAGTAVARGKLGEDGLENVEVIWRQKPKVEGRPLHFGSRLVFAPDGTLRRARGQAAGNLFLRPSSCARRRHPSRDGEALGDGVRPAWRGRAECHRAGQGLRLASGELGQTL
jgi:glucose/arabinose dehydrogenase